MGIANFNRQITVNIYGASQTALKQISTPDVGRKPNIEINGSFSTDDCIPAFNLVIKNFYLEEISQEYAKVEVLAGYKGAIKSAFIGDITCIYRDSPGPEGQTIIQCLNGYTVNWLQTQVSIKEKKGFGLEEILTKISNQLGYKPPSIESSLKNLKSNAPLEADEGAKTTIHRLRNMFDCIIRIENNQFLVFDKNSPQVVKKLDFLSAPPQLNGGKQGYTTAVITAPWDPTVKPGDKIRVSQNYFKSANNVRSSIKDEYATYVVNTLQFRYATAGKINQMVIQGTKTT